MALVEENTLRVSLKRFPRDVREELNKIVHRGSWQKLTREFSVDTYTGLEAKALDSIPDLVGSGYDEFREDVEKRLEILKQMKTGKTQSFKGKSKVGFHSYFYRFWLVGQRRQDGLYDIVFAHIARKEEFDLFLSLAKIMKGTAYTVMSVPNAVGSLSTRAVMHVKAGIFGESHDEEEIRSSADEARASPYTDLSQHLGDRLTDYEMVEDLIERGMLAENEDGTLYIQLS